MFRLTTLTTSLLAVLILLAAAPAWTERLTEAPNRDDPLHIRIEALDKLLRANHWNEGLILPCVIFPPAGDERAIVGNHEDVAGHTAMYLAACAHRYAVTKDPEVRKLADQLMDAIVKLETVTGVSGVAARSYYKTDQPLWHEDAFFFPMEWHESETMPGYRWQGDLSSDKFTDFIYGVGTYWEFCADDEHKKIAASFIDRFVGRCIEYNFKLVDVDGKMTLWGNFCPDLPHQPLNALEMLAGLKVAERLTGKPHYPAAYRRLIEKYHYDEETIMAKVLWPEEWTVPWDDHLAAKSFYMLMRYETDPDPVRKYRASLNRHWYDWKNAEFKRTAELWYVMLYQVLTGEQVVDDKTREAIKNAWGLYRDKRSYTIPTADGSRSVEAEQEEIATDLIRTYWFGRQYGIIDPDW